MHTKETEVRSKINTLQDLNTFVSRNAGNLKNLQSGGRKIIF